MQSNMSHKSQLEFFHHDTISWTRLTQNEPSMRYKILASTHSNAFALSGPADANEKFSSTLLLYYEPGYQTPTTPHGSPIMHSYKEEVMLLAGRLRSKIGEMVRQRWIRMSRCGHGTWTVPSWWERGMFDDCMDRQVLSFAVVLNSSVSNIKLMSEIICVRLYSMYCDFDEKESQLLDRSIQFERRASIHHFHFNETS
jgi:hypothetical protein